MRIAGGLVFMWLFLSQLLLAQNLSFEVIPDSVKKEADIVIRDSKIEFEIQSEGKAIKRTYISETIVNKSGEKKSGFNVYYDDLHKIKKLSALLIDAQGKLVKKYRESDFEDGASGGGSISDGRVKYIRFHQAQFPYTTVLTLEEEYEGIVAYPFWYPVSGYNCGVEKSQYCIIHPEEMKIQIKQLNCDLNPEISITKGIKTTKWSLSGLKPIEGEPYSPKMEFIFPSIWTAPVNFEYDGTTGSMESWESFAKWVWELMEGRDQLPEDTKAEVRSLVDTIVSERRKIEVLYKYMQHKTRYVSIQLGIGGWQPFPASKVDETGYGDCKALSNYMRSLLKEVGIESFYTKIGNGSTRILFEDFACMGQTNHIVLCVPQVSDTIWLECTSQTMPFGYIGKSNSNRKAVLVTENGGVMVDMPVFKSLDNKQVRHCEVHLDEAGEALLKANTVYSGGQFDNRSYVTHQNEEDQKKWLLKNLDVSSPILNSVDYSTPKMIGGLPWLEENIDVTLRKFSSKTGSRIFFPIMVMENFEATPPQVEDRKNDVYKEFGYLDVDTIEYNLPEGYRVEFVPLGDTIKSMYGEYVLSLDVHEDRIQVCRKLHMKDGLWPAESYEDMRTFYADIRKTDNSKVVLVKDDE